MSLPQKKQIPCSKTVNLRVKQGDSIANLSSQEASFRLPTTMTTPRITLIACAAMLALPCSATAKPASEAKIRNVLLIVADDLKADVLGCYGSTACKTPHIDQLAKQGLVFDRAYCQAAWCAPSRQSFMYSRYQGKVGTTLGEHFKNHGFYSARVSKIFHMRVPGDIMTGADGEDVAACWTERFNCQGKESGTPGAYACLNLNLFSDQLEGRETAGDPNRMFITVQADGDGSEQPDHMAATKTIELLRQHKDQPFFIATGLIRPHYPNVAPKSYFDAYPWQDIKLPEVPENDLDDIPKIGRTQITNGNNPIGKHPDNQKRMWAGYQATVTFMDDQVGRIIAELDRLGLRESTAVILISDHGYLLGEHTFWQKSNLHDEVMQVPLIVDVPGMPAGHTQAITELLDIYPTLAELAGIPIPNDVQGKSFAKVLADPSKSVRSDALCLERGGAVLRSDRHAYIRYRNGEEELYDMQNDPQQFTNLAKNPEHADTIVQLRLQLDARLKAEGIKLSKK